MAGAGRSSREESNGILYREVLPLFKEVIHAVDLIDIACISHRLTTEQMERVRQKSRVEGARSAARELLDCLYKKPGWFECLMKALDDPAVKLTELKPEFFAIKDKVDQEWELRTRKKKDAPPPLPQRGNLPRIRESDGEGASGVCDVAQAHSANLSPKQESSHSGASEQTQCKQFHVGSESEDNGGYSRVYIPRLEDESWYVGNKSRSEADAMLENCCFGTFLVRFNDAEKRHSLYVRGHGQTLHLMINRKSHHNGPMRYYLDVSVEGFETIQSLVEYYSTHDFTTNDEPNKLRLIHPALLMQVFGDSETAANGFRAVNLSVSTIKESNA